MSDQQQQHSSVPEATAHEAPVHGQLYVATGQGHEPEGTAALYVRTEQRPGAPGPQHLLVQTHERVVFERWEDPAEFEARWTKTYTPPLDPDESHAARRERDAFVATFRELRNVVVAEARQDVPSREAVLALAERVRLKLRERYAHHRGAVR